MHPNNFAHKWQYVTILLFFKALWWDFKKTQTQTKPLYTSCRIYYKPQVLKLHFPNNRPETRNFMLFCWDWQAIAKNTNTAVFWFANCRGHRDYQKYVRDSTFFSSITESIWFAQRKWWNQPFPFLAMHSYVGKLQIWFISDNSSKLWYLSQVAPISSSVTLADTYLHRTIILWQPQMPRHPLWCVPKGWCGEAFKSLSPARSRTWVLPQFDHFTLSLSNSTN